MSTSAQDLSTGLPGLDRILKGLLPGDNIVWQADAVDDYRALVQPYWQWARRRQVPVVYVRFAEHEPLIEHGQGVHVLELDPEAGFEAFINEVRQTIKAAGRGAYYVFDCLSELAVDWYSDQMLGNFFMLTCPYLYDMETIAYFMLRRNAHSVHATDPISNTTQLFLEVFGESGKLYVYPLKVQHRYSPTMHMLHAWEGEEFRPVSESGAIAEVMRGAPSLQSPGLNQLLGVWQRTFLQAGSEVEPADTDRCSLEQAGALQARLLRMAVSREERMLQLASKHLRMSDLLAVGNRMIGTGLIGGKAVGMLLARAILTQASERWGQLLERHDSFHIGSDVFYTFLVRNGIWWVREKQRDPATYLDDAGTARQRMLTGAFPEHVEQQFERMLDYFGQSPFIVRSSSLLEDNFGNAFAGKYDSVFCVNQGPRHQRLEDFMAAVRAIYASAMSERALTYRAQRGLLDRDEQMALLVQRVSGAVHGSLYYPDVAGVALSYNPYVWDEAIDPQAGALRLVFGLGTRAVDRSDDDYTRVVALNAPERRPEQSHDGLRRYAQRRVDLLDLEGNRLVGSDFGSVAAQRPGLDLPLYASRDEQAERRARELGIEPKWPWILTFDGLLERTDFVQDMREMLRILEDAYEYPVDVEFTANFGPDGSYKINVVQCRPLQVKGGGAITDPPEGLAPEQLALTARGAVIGPSALQSVDRVLYVTPHVYGSLSIPERYQVARLIGQVAHLGSNREGLRLTQLLVGPGRWGTTTPALGVPVSFAEISPVTAVCEVVAMRDDLVPDVSLGTHFLSELIEMDVVYTALFPGREGNWLNTELLESAPNRLTALVPGAEPWEDVVRVVEARDLGRGRRLMLNVNSPKQRVVLYVE